MGDQLRLAVDDAPALEGPRAMAMRAYVDALEMARHPHAENTIKAYKRAWKRWGTWCDLVQGTEVGDLQKEAPLPVHPGALVAHLLWLTRMGVQPNGVRQACAALSSIDCASRVTPHNPHPLSVRKSPVVQRFLQKWQKKNPKKPKRQSAALDKVGLRGLVAALEPTYEPTTVRRSRSTGAKAHGIAYRIVRDRAMVLMGLWGAMRASELAALDVADVALVPRGIELTVGAGKTDQAGAGLVKCILPCGEVGLCLVHAWQQWLAVRGTEPGSAFGLSKRAVEHIIKSAARRAGLGELVTSHSLRTTFINLAEAAGHPLHKVSAHVGHTSLDTTVGYTRKEDLWKDTPTQGLI